VVHGVGRSRRHFLVVDLEVLGDLCGAFQVAVQTDKAGVECSRVGFEHLGRVALGIDRDEQCLEALAVGAEKPLDLGRPRQGRRADIWALSEAEEDQDGLASEVRQRALIAIRVGEPDVRGIGCTGQIDTFVRGDVSGLFD